MRKLAAEQFARSRGGTIVELQTPWSNVAPVYGIELAGRQVMDAVKSGEIAKLMGVQYTPAMANLATALAGGANASS
jgi:hypothetical protein